MVRHARLAVFAALALLLPCLAAAQGPYPAMNGEAAPPDFDIRGRDGTLIRVSYQPLLAPSAPDRADICFAVSSSLAPGKTFVMNQNPEFTYDGATPGPDCRSVFTDFDHDSYDMARDRRKNMGARASSFGKRMVNPKAWSVQMAFYKDAAQTRRVEVVTTQQVTDIINLDSNSRDFFVPVAAGWRTTLFWLQE